MSDRELSLVITEVSLMPDILGFSMVKTLAYAIVCVLGVGIAGAINLGLVAWAIAIEFVMTIVLVSIVVATPSHLTLRQFFGYHLRKRYGQQLIRHDSFAERDYPDFDTYAETQDNE
ncbi:hypothetical protein OB920_05230 [Halobacteria archaeon HArc-gm2]|nr:hypothetical protein [Halobacteria archaeon HArc-gm2]